MVDATFSTVVDSQALLASLERALRRVGLDARRPFDASATPGQLMRNRLVVFPGRPAVEIQVGLLATIEPGSRVRLFVHVECRSLP